MYTIRDTLLDLYGNDNVFRKVIDDLNSLQSNGLIINVDAKEQRVYFKCVLVLGDNLGLNVCCGFFKIIHCK